MVLQEEAFLSKPMLDFVDLGRSRLKDMNIYLSEFGVGLISQLFSPSPQRNGSWRVME